MRKIENLPNDFEQSSEHSEEKKVLSIRELLEVQGGLGTDDYLDDCTERQCVSFATVSCTSGAIKV